MSKKYVGSVTIPGGDDTTSEGIDLFFGTQISVFPDSNFAGTSLTILSAPDLDTTPVALGTSISITVGAGQCGVVPDGNQAQVRSLSTIWLQSGTAQGAGTPCVIRYVTNRDDL